MSLLWMEYEDEFQKLTDAAFYHEKKENPEYFSTLGKKVQKIIYRDTRYNIDYLYTSYVLNEDKIMEDYSVWLYQLLSSIFKNRNHAQTADYIINHLDKIKEGVLDTIPEDRQASLLRLLTLAQNCIKKAASDPAVTEQTAACLSPYEAEIQQYLDSLFQKNMRGSLYLIQQFTQKGIPVNDIYVEILAESMRRIGELWHTAQISVDTEHYCTSVTQMAMAQMYPLLFAQERKGRTILCACPGTELHEIGARMVADLFENDGWDSIYLGAAVPEDALLNSIRSNKPDLVALSVTMPQHLITCRELVDSIRKKFPEIKIAVGGKAFQSTYDIWTKWQVDIYTNDARQLLTYANKEFCTTT